MYVVCRRSRNALLSPESRRNALCLNQALKWAETAVQQHQMVLAQDISAEVQKRITSSGGQVDYVQVMSPVPSTSSLKVTSLILLCNQASSDHQEAIARGANHAPCNRTFMGQALNI